ncbi:hypothetical protein JCGZ_24954 [Jatropha curcas]|uniref:Uncharacterized protein n=1 Tax=Jatropha curcas TaxID=180498 RepID=A0A067L8X8_JATCU|nr:hypothetical protein JCGZ_24954 [Jatropha curcas]
MSDTIVLSMRVFQIKLLNSFKVYIVESCEAPKELFDVEGLNADEGHVVMALQFNELHLIKLPRLKHNKIQSQSSIKQREFSMKDLTFPLHNFSVASATDNFVVATRYMSPQTAKKSSLTKKVNVLLPLPKPKLPPWQRFPTSPPPQQEASPPQPEASPPKPEASPPPTEALPPPPEALPPPPEASSPPQPFLVPILPPTSTSPAPEPLLVPPPQAAAAPLEPPILPPSPTYSSPKPFLVPIGPPQMAAPPLEPPIFPPTISPSYIC